MKFDRHLGSSAADVPVKFQSDTTIESTNLVASRLYEILWKDVFSDIETGPRCWHRSTRSPVSFSGCPFVCPSQPNHQSLRISYIGITLRDNARWAAPDRHLIWPCLGIFEYNKEFRKKIDNMLRQGLRNDVIVWAFKYSRHQFAFGDAIHSTMLLMAIKWSCMANLAPFF